MDLASRQKRALVEAAGRVVERDGHRHYLFPTPEMVLDRESAVERALNNDRKARTVRAAADLFAGTDLRALPGDADLQRLGDRYGERRGYWAHYLRVWAFQREERGR